MGRATTAVIILLQIYFLAMNFTVEQTYCHSELRDARDRMLVNETIDFCKDNNPYFLARPEWMRVATCISGYGFCVGYALIIVAAVTGAWSALAVPLLLFLGMKINALGFYHIMEFLSATPPQNLIPYFAMEGPYLLAIFLVVMKVRNSLRSHSKLKAT
eukprot:gb/GEZN01021011.1/.p1 GENE.gb/GEZN01021011.1/~~gb/GEZN01021011.1/.p1  ORF type:complete len:159 (+),score=17.79 gb/GEZN01021011.1/:61-537(+)